MHCEYGSNQIVHLKLVYILELIFIKTEKKFKKIIEQVSCLNYAIWTYVSQISYVRPECLCVIIIILYL